MTVLSVCVEIEHRSCRILSLTAIGIPDLVLLDKGTHDEELSASDGMYIRIIPGGDGLGFPEANLGLQLTLAPRSTGKRSYPEMLA